MFEGKNGFGLKLKGIIVSCEVIRRSFKDDKSKQYVIRESAISTGKKTILYSEFMDDPSKDYPEYKELLKPVTIDVDRADTDKGKITVSGELTFDKVTAA